MAEARKLWWGKEEGPIMTESTEDRVSKLERDMYFGEGRDNPSMTVRMSMQEQKTESIERTLGKLLWLSLGTMISAAGGLAVLVLEHLLK